MPVLFCFGLGYSGVPLARYAKQVGFTVFGTSQLLHKDIQCFRFQEDKRIGEALAKTTHLVSTIPTSELGDPVLARYANAIKHIPWLCYCSSLAVYGDHKGAWINEDTPPQLPLSARAAMRLQAENLWQQQAQAQKANLCILRIAGIYGQGRNAIERINARSKIDSTQKDIACRPIIRSDKVFNRIHVDDLVATMARALELQQGGLFNVCDDLPAPAHEVMLYAAKLLRREAPEFVDYRQARKRKLLSEMALSFHREHKRACNERMKKLLGVRLLYPNYRSGLEALLSLEQSR